LILQWRNKERLVGQHEDYDTAKPRRSEAQFGGDRET
jgi:hypothetical protein